MSFTFDSYAIFSKIEKRNLIVRSGLGVYLIEIHLNFVPHNPQGGGYFVDDLCIGVEFGSDRCPVGVARPASAEFMNMEGFIDIRQMPHGQMEIPRCFRAYVPRATLEELESVRNGGDALFWLTVCGKVESRDAPERGPQRGCEQIRVSIPQSDWVRHLQETGYQKTILIEIPTPEVGEFHAAVRHLEVAQVAFTEGRYTDAVAECRKALESINIERAWPPNVKTKEERDNMSVEERFRLSWYAIYHVTHSAHHANGKAAQFVRSTAQYIIGATSLALSLAGKQRDIFTRTN